MTGRMKKTPKMIADICSLVSGGSNLEQIGKMKGYPCKDAMYRWRNEDASFQDDYTRARENRADWRASDMDATVQDLKDGKIDYQTARIAIDNHKWQAGKENPQVYGEKLTTDNTNHNLNEEVERSTDAELERVIHSGKKKT